MASPVCTPTFFSQLVTRAIEDPSGIDVLDLESAAFEFLAAPGSRVGLSDAECERIDCARALARAAWDWCYSQSDADYQRMVNSYRTAVMLQGLTS